MTVHATMSYPLARATDRSWIRLLANFVGYQAVWFTAVIAAAHGLAWPGAVAWAAFAAWQLSVARQRRLQIGLIAIALGCGLVLDGLLAASDWIDYAAADIALPPGAAPLWILALWASFALTVTRSLQFLQKRLWVASLFGAVGGPLAYWAASRAWGVVTFTTPQWHALAGLAIGWGLAMPLLAGVARRVSRATDAGTTADAP